MENAEKSSGQPLFLITHSRSCSTAFERVFIGRPDKFKCIHEPFGDAFYYGPERMSNNMDQWPPEKLEKVKDKTHRTFGIVINEIFDTTKAAHDRFVLIKDMSYHIIPPKDSAVKDPPSLQKYRKNDASPGSEENSTAKRNPTLLPLPIINSFRYAFLIRSPYLAVPSLYRLHIPPLSHQTLLKEFKPKEIGYREMRMFIEYLYADADGKIHDGNGPVVIDAADLLANPEGTLRAFCQRVGASFDPDMLSWDAADPEAAKLFDKFAAYHQDAQKSDGLRSKTADEEAQEKVGRQRPHTPAEMEDEWLERYGEEGASKIKSAVTMCEDDYVWLKKFKIDP